MPPDIWIGAHGLYDDTEASEKLKVYAAATWWLRTCPNMEPLLSEIEHLSNVLSRETRRAPTASPVKSRCGLSRRNGHRLATLRNLRRNAPVRCFPSVAGIGGHRD